MTAFEIATVAILLFLVISPWQRASSEVTSAYENKHEFKIFTLHRDEDELLLDWVKYHARIVGITNLYILDNNSTDPTVLADLRAIEKASDARPCTHAPNASHAAIR